MQAVADRTRAALKRKRYKSFILGGGVSLNSRIRAVLNEEDPDDIFPDEDLTFTSQDEETATVDEKGVVTGVAAGEAVITIEYKALNAAGEEEVILTKDAKVTVIGD